LAELERRLAEVERLARTRGRHVEVDRVVDAAHRLFADRVFTVRDLVAAGVVAAADARAVGRALVRSVRVGVVGEDRDGLLYIVRVCA
jgi:hypothetical protein